MKLTGVHLLFGFFLLTLSHSYASAGIRPSFYLEDSSWNATDIVVATEGKKIDGVFLVLESLKGPLQPGETIKIPELAIFADEKSRVVKDAWYKPLSLVVTGERMVLFLKRDTNQPLADADHRLPPATSLKWKAASHWNEFNVSVVWVEQGKSFSFVQLSNPGPSLLVSLNISEADLRSQIVNIQKTQTDFLGAAAVTDPGQKAEALAPFVHQSLYQAREAAFEELKKCGKAALPVLRRMIADESLLRIHSSLVDVLAEAGNSDAAGDLVALLDRDLGFWRRNGPALESGWWNGTGFSSLEDVEPLRDRYSRDYQALHALTKTPFRGSESLLIGFRDFWKSLPQLAEIGSNQLFTLFDEALQELSRLKTGTNAIRFEGLQTFGEEEFLRALRDKGLTASDVVFSNPEVIEKARTVIREVLSAKGYTHATITAEVDQSSRTLTFKIDEGKRAAIADIRFEGNRTFSSDRLAAMMKQCIARYEADGYDSSIFDYCEHYMSNSVGGQGYLQARFYDRRLEENEAGLIITTQVSEGVLYRLGAIKIEGTSAFSAETIRSNLRLHRGDIADGEQLAKWLFEVVKKLYGEAGYIQYTADIDPTFKSTTNAAEGLVDLAVTIDEGKQFKIGKISFKGEDIPQEELQQLLLIHRGEIYNQSVVEKAIEKLNESALFESIDKDKDVDYATNEEDGLVNLIITVRKRQGK